ncbi:MAG: GNAT family N-acetyltransferase, partial [Planctomycetes bacterium]|nr:GNAT family N-acetyltransferase [Planctomycetota bacterium]
MMCSRTTTLRDGRSALIRPLTDNDTELLLRCFHSFGAEARSFFAPHPFSREVAEDICSRAPTEKAARRFIVTENAPPDEEPLGYAFLWFLDQEVPSLGICLVESAIGQGLGRCVIEFLLERARELGYDAIRLTVVARNKRARALYEVIGFRYYGDRTWSEHARGWSLKMKRDLTQDPPRRRNHNPPSAFMLDNPPNS